MSRRILCLLVMASGFASLSWEVLWQVKSTLALGVSAWGTAITLAASMSGMSAGGYLMGRALSGGGTIAAMRLYGLLEIAIGLCGLFLGAAFQELEQLDSWAYAQLPGSAALVQALGMVAALGLPAACMGATLPVFAALAASFNMPVTQLYGLNTFGAAAGVLSAALIMIPLMGIGDTGLCIAFINLAVGLYAWRAAGPKVQADREVAAPRQVARQEASIVFVTGFATFALEIAWFRALASAFPNTTDAFALMLSCVLIGLGLGAASIPRLAQQRKSLAVQLCMAGVLILLAMPLMERFDSILYGSADHGAAVHARGLLNPDSMALSWTAVCAYIVRVLAFFLAMFWVIVPPVQFLGIAFPWMLGQHRTSREIGILYAINTLAAIVGALAAAWLLLPVMGVARTAWLAGALVLVTGVGALPCGKRLPWLAVGAAALLVAVSFDTGVGRTRAQGYFAHLEGRPAKLLGYFDGPDATVSVVEYGDGERRLLIDSAAAAGESGAVDKPWTHYMAWMGRLPMLLHPGPKNALVICFGTGQTANAVRREGIASLDAVDVNPRVFQLAPYFRSNENVLGDPHVHPVVMDGRAYLRRVHKAYDVITLEPMPPTNAGVNALYSREFYALARQRLSPQGIMAQWLPFEAVSPLTAASIARTFIEVFPHAVLWIDPVSHVGILLGSKADAPGFGKEWPGFARAPVPRNLTRQEVQQAVALDAAALQRYGAYGRVITDDNQLLAYGRALYASLGLTQENFELLHRVNEKITVPR